jgi:hypothetical protein
MRAAKTFQLALGGVVLLTNHAIAETDYVSFFSNVAHH